MERTGREKQAMEMGLVVEDPRRHTTTFGKDISNDVVLSDEQVGKLEQLRDEATKAAAAASAVNTNNNRGNESDGGGGSRGNGAF
jgi:hypothetical protein